MTLGSPSTGSGPQSGEAFATDFGPRLGRPRCR
jgi:hypothetical protein